MAAKPIHGHFFDLSAALASGEGGEHFEALTSREGARIERIVSRGQASPPGFWYDQDEHEWVIVLRGTARLTIEGQPTLELAAGDWVDLPAHCRHRVEWTDPDAETVWLAFFSPASARPEG